MTECGFQLTVDWIAEVTEAVPEAKSRVGWSFNTKRLADRYRKMGLKVVMCETNGVVNHIKVSCQICGAWDAPKGTTFIQCNAQKHRDFYDAFPS